MSDDHSTSADFTGLKVDIDAVLDDNPRITADSHQSPDTVPFSKTPQSSDQRNAPKSSASTPSSTPGGTNVFIAGIPSAWGQTKLREVLSQFGNVISVRIVPDRHFGFALFSERRAAEKCIKELHGTKATPASTATFHVSIAMHDEGAEEEPNSRLFIRGLPHFVTSDSLASAFRNIKGVTVQDVSVIVNAEGHCKGSGFVTLETTEQAKMCIKELHGRLVPFFNAVEKSLIPAELIVKYSESEATRAERQKRNKERKQSLPKTASQPSSANSTPMQFVPMMQGPPPSTSPPLVATANPNNIGQRSPTGRIPMMNTPMTTTAMATAGHPGLNFRDMYDNRQQQQQLAMMQPQQMGPMAPPLPQMRPFQVVPPAPSMQVEDPRPAGSAHQTLMLHTPLPTFPRGGDLFLQSNSLTSTNAVQLVTQIAGEAPDLIVPVQGGFAVRLHDQASMSLIAVTLNNAAFANGDVLRCGIIQMGS